MYSLDMLTAFFIGIAIGIAATVPAAWWWSRKIERRMRVLAQAARRSERLAELGTMTSGLAHEIKNPLSTVGLNIQLLHEDLDEIIKRLPRNAETGSQTDEEIARVQRRFGSLGRETQRLKDILEDFLRFAGRVQLDPKITDIHELIGELIDFFAPQASEAEVNLRTQLAANPSRIKIDGPLLKQSLLNLMINAVQAMVEAREKNMPHGGASELIIRTDCEKEMGQNTLSIHVIDTGPGISKESKEKIFQPYFSTKKGGTGLGLPTSRRIVEEHGGHMDVHAEVGKGTDFVIVLPIGE
ncbi:sensor histidine kinase [Poriferisphaera sp. WC338]|uniref:sensor histidine kinase n=1 Tax=Poriferisphaera sp. WC338 TaxID=3425129 RepID=UPI003D818B5A